MSQRELAERTGLSPSILSKLESGQQAVVRDETLNKLSRGLGLNIDNLRKATRRGPDIATDPWGKGDNYLIDNIWLELHNFIPSDSTQVWLVLGLLTSTDWRIRRAAVTSLTRAAQEVVAIDSILRALSFIAENDAHPRVREGAETGLKLLFKPHQQRNRSQ